MRDRNNRFSADIGQILSSDSSRVDPVIKYTQFVIIQMVRYGSSSSRDKIELLTGTIVNLSNLSVITNVNS